MNQDYCIHCHGLCTGCTRTKKVVLCDKKTHEVTPYECANCPDREPPKA